MCRICQWLARRISPQYSSFFISFRTIIVVIIDCERCKNIQRDQAKKKKKKVVKETKNESLVAKERES